MSDSIYERNAQRTRPFEVTTPSTVWEPVPLAAGTLSTNALLAQPHSMSNIRKDVEVALVTALIRPIAPGETSATGNARREAELRALIDQLTVVEAFALGRRIDMERPDDALAQAFKRLVVERRVRLRAYVADARRRAALLAR